MKPVGVLLILGGIALGLYAGLWWALIGGICQIVEFARDTSLPAMTLAIGIGKVMFAEVIGFLSAIVLIVPGSAMLVTKK